MSTPLTLDDVEQSIVNYVKSLTRDAAGVQSTLENTEDDADCILADIVADAVSSWGSLHELDSSDHWHQLTAETQSVLFESVAAEVHAADMHELAAENFTEIIYNSDIMETFWEFEDECEDILDSFGRADRTIRDQMTISVNEFALQCLAELLQEAADAFDEDDCRQYVQNEMEAGV